MPLARPTHVLCRLLAPLALALAVAAVTGAPPALADSGSVTDIRQTGVAYGAPLQATFSATSDTCETSYYCGWFPIATRTSGDRACSSSDSVVWVGSIRSGPGVVTETTSFYPERTGTNRLCVFIHKTPSYYKVADVVFTHEPSAPPAPPGGATPTTRTDPIPYSIGVQGIDWYYVNDRIGPSYIDAARFVQLAKATGSRWGLSFAGKTSAYPLRDGMNTVGFSFNVSGEPLGVEIEYLRNKYRRKRLCRTHRHRSGRRHRHCRRGKRRKVGTELTGEKDVQINALVPWDQGPGRPGMDLFDLETTLIHEMGHFAGNDHVSGCVNSPMADALDTGEWWRGTNDWLRWGCSNSTYRRKGKSRGHERKMVHITVPPGQRGPVPVIGRVPRLHR